MPFIGNQPAESYSAFQKQDFTTSATTSYTLDNPVANANELALFINFVRQEPTTAYTASGTSLTLTSATSASDDMYCVYLGKAVQTVNPPNASVGLSQLSATGTKDATTFLRGDNTFASAGESNLPYFYVTRDSNQTLSVSTFTVVQFDSVELDTASGWDGTNYRYVPNVAGKYFFQFVHQSTYGGTAPVNEYSELRKNGTSVVETSARGSGHGYGSITQGSAILTMNGSSDYVDTRAYGDSGTSYILEGNGTLKRTYLLGYLISKT